MKTMFQAIVFWTVMLLSGVVFALSADAPPVNHKLVNTIAYKVDIGKAQNNFDVMQVTLIGNTTKDKQSFKFFCKQSSPNLIIAHNVPDENGELSEWANGLAIQYYEQGETMARDLFMSEKDLLIVGKTPNNLREALGQLAKKNKGHFTFTLFSTGMHGEITTNVISKNIPVQAAQAILDKMTKMAYGAACDLSTGQTNNRVEIYQDKNPF